MAGGRLQVQRQLGNLFLLVVAAFALGPIALLLKFRYNVGLLHESLLKVTKPALFIKE